MQRHSPRSLARLVHSARLQSAQVRTLSGHAARGLPLPLLPSTFPSRMSFIIVLCLLMWPKKLIFLDFIVSRSFLFVPNFLRTCSFVTFCCQLIFPILLKNTCTTPQVYHIKLWSVSKFYNHIIGWNRYSN